MGGRGGGRGRGREKTHRGSVGVIAKLSSLVFSTRDAIAAVTEFMKDALDPLEESKLQELRDLVKEAIAKGGDAGKNPILKDAQNKIELGEARIANAVNNMLAVKDATDPFVPNDLRIALLEYERLGLKDGSGKVTCEC